MQSCPTLCDPTDCSPPGSSVHGDSPGKNAGVGCHALFQGIFPTQGCSPGLPHCRRNLYHLSHQGSPRILEWVAYPFSRESSPPSNPTGVSCIAGGFFSWATREVQSAFTHKEVGGAVSFIQPYRWEFWVPVDKETSTKSKTVKETWQLSAGPDPWLDSLLHFIGTVNESGHKTNGLKCWISVTFTEVTNSTVIV